MSKYIIDIPKTVGMGKVGSVHYTYFDGIQVQTIVLKGDEIEELNSDYINEHFSDLQDMAYQRGLDDAWEAARKVGHCKLWDDYTKDTGKPSVCAVAVLDHYTAYEAIEKLKAYEEKQKAEDEIKVGDEVRRKTAPTNERGGIVTKEYENTYYIMWTDGSSGQWDKDKVVKTGRHFDIASILKEMQS